MPHRQTARLALRAATAAAHERVDAIFSAADLASRDGYRTFLAAQAAAHLPVEAALDRDGITAVVSDWPDRQRAHLLRADLADLDTAAPTEPALIAFAGPAELLGGLYVLEGSRLGGSLLKRSVAPDLPARFLGAADPGLWRKLLTTLDERIDSDDAVAAAVAAAERVFEVFAASGQRWLKAD